MTISKRSSLIRNLNKRIKDIDLGANGFPLFTKERLFFYNPAKAREAKILRASDKTVDELVIAVLKLSWKYGSSYMRGDAINRWARAGSYRSAYDIYNHISSFRPDVNIEDIITSIVHIQGELRIQYCYTIHQRVVYLRIDPADGGESPPMLGGLKDKDEFGIAWSEWCVIANSEEFIEYDEEEEVIEDEEDDDD
jgi:hypothetical protein